MDYPRDYNAAVDLVDRHAEQGRGDKPAFIDPERTLTYGALRDGCARRGRLLRAHRLEAESRVAMLVLDTVDFPVIFLGCIRAGVVPVVLNTLLTTEDMLEGGQLGEYRLRDPRPTAAVTSRGTQSSTPCPPRRR